MLFLMVDKFTDRMERKAKQIADAESKARDGSATHEKTKWQPVGTFTNAD